MAGLLISFEGGEGVGKGTQVGLLKQALEAKGLTVELTREPGGTPIGEKIRYLLKFDPDGKNMTNEAELLLFISGRAQNFFQRIVPALEAGRVVICDRFIDSSAVYQGIGRGLGVDNVRWLNDFATGGRKPDITFVLDVPEEVGFARVHKRAPEVQLTLNMKEGTVGAAAERSGHLRDRLDDFGLEAARQIREGYLRLAREEPNRFVVIDANRDIQTIAKEILSHVERRLAAGAAK